MSTLNLRALSTILGIILYNVVEDVYKQGLVLISMSQGLKCSSIIKSNPKISKVGILFHFPNR